MPIDAVVVNAEAVHAGTRGRLATRPAFVVLVAVSIAFLAASSALTPLYSIYQREWALSPVDVTVVFAAYPVAFLIALLIVGSLSDHVGRRSVLLGALVLEIVVMVLFLNSGDATELIMVRALQGIATGAATAAIGAALTDLSPRMAPVFNSIAPLIGLAIGALGSAAIAVAVPLPTVAVFVVLIVLFVTLLVIAAFLPETATRRSGALASLRVSLLIPTAARKAVIVSTPVLVAAWAIGGFVLSLGPSLLRAQTGSTSPLLGGWLVFVLNVAGALTVVVLRKWPARRVFGTGAAALIAGLIVILSSVALDSPALLFTGAAVTGVGYGGGFQGVMRTVMPLADATDRAGLLSTVFVISYLALSVPAIGAGLLSAAVGIQTTTIIIGGAAIVLALIALLANLRRGTNDQ